MKNFSSTTICGKVIYFDSRDTKNGKAVLNVTISVWLKTFTDENNNPLKDENGYVQGDSERYQFTLWENEAIAMNEYLSGMKDTNTPVYLTVTGTARGGGYFSESSNEYVKFVTIEHPKVLGDFDGATENRSRSGNQSRNNSSNQRGNNNNGGRRWNGNSQNQNDDDGDEAPAPRRQQSNSRPQQQNRRIRPS